MILAGAKIGNGAAIGAGAIVEAEVPDYAIVGGNLARIVGWARPAPGADRPKLHRPGRTKTRGDSFREVAGTTQPAVILFDQPTGEPDRRGVVGEGASELSEL